MSKVSATPDQDTKTPFYLSDKNQNKPVGHLVLDNDTLVLEFQDEYPTIRIKQAEANLVDIVDDSSISVESPDNPGTHIRFYLPNDGKGRFIVYAIREWTGIDGTEPRARRKRAFLTRFESSGAKLAALWQLALPYILFGTTFLLHTFITDSASEVEYYDTGWQQLALSPVVAIHYVILLIPAIAILFYNRAWGLLAMFQMSLLLVLLVVGCSFLSDSWQFLPVPENPLSLPGYWLVFVPYVVLLLLPSFYYIVVLKRL